ncbi:unnamed protein product [Protopolystoma xenopodis]|uniref:Uncharacterized protein n=1 Tax=Protopolystoma xenopodis TaxID=117903 RepID=A0A3S5A6R5_9PLAT|nr:unnamed protein product [Protopolystoma xenopodis]
MHSGAELSPSFHFCQFGHKYFVWDKFPPELILDLWEHDQSVPLDASEHDSSSIRHFLGLLLSQTIATLAVHTQFFFSDSSGIPRLQKSVRLRFQHQLPVIVTRVLFFLLSYRAPSCTTATSSCYAAGPFVQSGHIES